MHLESWLCICEVEEAGAGARALARTLGLRLCRAQSRVGHAQAITCGPAALG